ncbi:hypothetical protein K501DRAFT_283104 [Backusella circina FSU 941]|nr:hypothetical protein K501DRAFT_283104 [Backusella circina FSU 941]
MAMVAFIVFILRRRREREIKFQTGDINYCHRSNRTANAVAFSVIAVLVTALVSFILFVSEKQDFLDWCITSSTSYVNATYNEVNTASSKSTINLSTSIDYYNCERLFQDEVKWSLMCLAVLLAVYLHWIVIIYTIRSKYFVFDQFANVITLVDPHGHMPPPVVTGELNSIPPKKRGIISLSNIKPSKLKIPSNFKLFQKKAVNGTELPTQNEIEKSFYNHTTATMDSNNTTPEVATDSNIQGTNVIYFEDDIHNSKQEVMEPIEYRQTETSSSTRPTSSATLVNMSN